MNYYFINTDAESTGRRRFPFLIRQGIAATAGARRFGEQLGQLAPDDTLLMYENGLGVVAVGRVRERWDGQTHATPSYYPASEAPEYRIKVEWFCDLSNKPITIPELKRRVTSTPRGAVRRIVKRRVAVERMVGDLCTP